MQKMEADLKIPLGVVIGAPRPPTRLALPEIITRTLYSLNTAWPNSI